VSKRKRASKPKPKKQDLKMPDLSAYDQGGSPSLGQTRVSAIAESIGRTWGRTAAMPLDVAPVARVRTLPFGILMLDWLTKGGLRVGGINRLWGPKSVLKSTLCLRALSSAQNHCRHCKTPLVRHPDCTCQTRAQQERLGLDFGDAPCPVKVRQAEGEDVRCVDCRCPKPRFWLMNEDDYPWLPAKAALEISNGQLPDGHELRTVEHPTLGKVALPAIDCDPPEHVVKAAGKAKPKPRQVVFAPANRCEPWRCLYLDSEGTIDERWARENGVDTSNVLLVGSGWAEKSLSTIEEAVVAQEFDLIIIDSISMLNPQSNQEKALDESPVVAAHANVMGRFITRHIAQCFEEGLTARYRPTVLLTSQVTTKNIGWGKHPFLGPTGGNKVEHACSLDLRLMARGYTFDATNTVSLHGDFEFEISKHKYGGSCGVSGTIRYWLVRDADHAVGDSDDLDVVMRYARELGEGFLKDGSGKARLTLYSDFIDGGEKVFPRVGDCTAFLRAHTPIYDDLRARVLQVLWARGAALKV